MFKESEAIENLVNNGSVDNFYNLGWSDCYSAGEKSPPRFDADHPYVQPDRTFHYPINDKTNPEDLQCHFGKIHALSNNCIIEEIRSSGT